jgi:stearoyl-CoA desaturase (delta-9 desaturase)
VSVRTKILRNAPFVALQFVPLLAFFTGVTRTAVILAVALWVGRMFFITGGYHRYFAHRSFKLGRVAQAVFAFGGLTAAQKGPLWWAGNHRDHHRFADTERDPHSPQQGIWWSHMGWILSGKFNEKDYDKIPDFAKYPELRFMDKHDWIGPWALGVACYLIAGWSGLLIGFFASTVVLWHTTFAVNSVAHLFGRRRYGSDDTSRNSLTVALFTMGEGWHNNHHHYPASARQGFFWWEIDPTFYILRLLSLVGVVRDLKSPPQAVKGAARVRRGHLDLGLFRFHLNRAAKAARSDALVPPLRDLAAQAEALAKQARQAERASA